MIQGNYSGVGADGHTPVGNLLHGVVLRSDDGLPAPLGPGQANEPGVKHNLVGGTTAGAGNLIEFNGTGGVAVFKNPQNASFQNNDGNAILGNSIYLNGRSNPHTLLGIDLVTGPTFPTDDGITPNDAGDADVGPNETQNFPVLTSAKRSGSSTVVTGSLSTKPNQTYRVEFFASDPDPAARNLRHAPLWREREDQDDHGPRARRHEGRGGRDALRKPLQRDRRIDRGQPGRGDD